MKLAALAAGIVAMAAGAAYAGPWQTFSFGGVGSTSGPFTVTTTAAEPYLNVTDAFLSGDRFRIDFLTGPLAGQQIVISIPTTQGDQINSDYDGAYADALGRWSRGSVLVGPATFDFNIYVIDSPFESGGAAYRTNELPTPGAAAVLGLGGLMAARRRRSR